MNCDDCEVRIVVHAHTQSNTPAAHITSLLYISLDMMVAWNNIVEQKNFLKIVNNFK